MEEGKTSYSLICSSKSTKKCKASLSANSFNHQNKEYALWYRNEHNHTCIEENECEANDYLDPNCDLEFKEFISDIMENGYILFPELKNSKSSYKADQYKFLFDKYVHKKKEKKKSEVKMEIQSEEAKIAGPVEQAVAEQKPSQPEIQSPN